MFRCMYLYAANLEFILFLTEQFILTCPQLSFSSIITGLTLDFTCMKQTYLQEYCVYESGVIF